MKILTIVGARPQFIKAAAVSRAILADPKKRIQEEIVHTGQHYDAAMSDVFFNDMGIPEPVVNLEIGSGLHAAVTGRMMLALESEILHRKPNAVMVYGDTNSTLAGALAASKLNIPIVHVEAGLRSFNMRMPEEINRVLTDRVSSLLLCPTYAAVKHLATEGITENVHHVGDVMYDAALDFGQIAKSHSHVLDTLELSVRSYYLVTVHRAENTDDPTRLKSIMRALQETASVDCPVILPLHPRTREKLVDHGIQISDNSALRIIDPISFLDMVTLEKNAKLILTDSGGVQKEAYFHGVPCVTLRDETEWTETVDAGWNQVVGADTQAIIPAVDSAKRGEPIHEYGKGNAAQKVIELIAEVQL